MIDSRFYTLAEPLTLLQIAEITGAELSSISDRSLLIHNVATLKEAQSKDMACFHNVKYSHDVTESKAGACFMLPGNVVKAPASMIPLITSSPLRAFGLAIQALYPSVDRVFISSTQAIHPAAKLGKQCIIEYGAVIHQNAQIGDYTCIGANAVIGPGVVIGSNCIIEPGVTISHSLIGDHVVIYSGARIGQAGFSFAMDKRGHIKVPQLGRVIIGDDVEIGANTTIDRGSLQDTVIGTGCRIDNQVQIAHNVVLGTGCVIVAQVGIAGSTRLGKHTIAAGQAGIAGHIVIGDHVKIAAQSGVMRNIADHETVAGFPAIPVKQWHRLTIAQLKLIQRKGMRS